MRNLRWISLLAVAILLFAAPPVARAADEEASPHPKYMVIHVDEVEPSMQSDYEKVNLKWVETFKEKRMGPEWNWWASNSLFTYVWASPMEEYSFLDGQDARYEKMAEVLGEEKMSELMAGGKAIKSHYTEILKYMPELTYKPAEPASKSPAVYRVTSHMVKPAMTEQFESLVKEVVAAFAKAGAQVNFTGYQTQYGTGSYYFTTMADSEEQLQGFPTTSEILAQAVGEERTAQILEEWRNCIDDYDTEDYQIRPDLTFVAAEKTD
ncbi:MAG: hypothetical protein EP299_02165 [Acidobacteria bacterium]|nr:MAG: hypothetical protein EP299_02165 [Acidobacteriota bacterium]